MNTNNKLYIGNEMAQLDRKNRVFYDELTDEEKKKFSTYLMLRWGSSVRSNMTELEKYYLLSTNQNMNKHFFDIGKHPKLQWLLATCISPNMGNQRHEWIAFKNRKNKNPRVKLLLDLYPSLKEKDAEILDQQMSYDDYKEILIALGWQDDRIKKTLKDIK